MNEQKRLQENLSLFRTCAGWTAESLAKQLDVSRQTISAWENYSEFSNKGIKLSKIQYLAIRKLIEDEIDKDLSDEIGRQQHILGTLLEVLVDHPDDYSTEDRNTIKEKAMFLAPSIVKKPEERKSVSAFWPALLIGGGVALSAAILALLKYKKK
jgi:DNA-binding XRE family transcriptional regulator